MVLKGWRRRFLIDVWAEPRDIAGLPAVVRARIRDLTTDEEQYMGSIAEIEQVIEARLDEDDVTPRRWERP
ncbi:hypothetical protein [Streptomyces sp. JNUCC 63]